ncbi:hypothetical protein DFH07DRAFT_979671 [Mycena maculata]|uniref:Ubiquitin-like protease family profile domain-containing protein n=1 Tax=Mycena maculata TaxID=230809 RepID=A0AAD7IJV6_9AGAR|nr:hypothetical protein DFH07DRAFT_979671 [Mycena maculata]
MEVDGHDVNPVRDPFDVVSGFKRRSSRLNKPDESTGLAVLKVPQGKEDNHQLPATQRHKRHKRRASRALHSTAKKLKSGSLSDEGDDDEDDQELDKQESECEETPLLGLDSEWMDPERPGFWINDLGKTSGLTERAKRKFNLLGHVALEHSEYPLIENVCASMQAVRERCSKDGVQFTEHAHTIPIRPLMTADPYLQLWATGVDLYIYDLHSGPKADDIRRELNKFHRLDAPIEVQVQCLRTPPAEDAHDANVDYTESIRTTTIDTMLDHAKNPNGLVLNLLKTHQVHQNPLLGTGFDLEVVAYRKTNGLSGFCQIYPSYTELYWELVGLAHSISMFHLDVAATRVYVAGPGEKFWIRVRRRNPEDLKAAKIDLRTKDLEDSFAFDGWDPDHVDLSTCELEGIALPAGTGTFLMQPGREHMVIGTDTHGPERSSVDCTVTWTIGGHFFAASSIRPAQCVIMLMVMLQHILTNTEHTGMWQFFVRICAFWLHFTAEGTLQDLIDLAAYLPNLSLSNARGWMDIIYLSCMIVLLPALDLRSNSGRDVRPAEILEAEVVSQNYKKWRTWLSSTRCIFKPAGQQLQWKKDVFSPCLLHLAIALVQYHKRQSQSAPTAFEKFTHKMFTTNIRAALKGYNTQLVPLFEQWIKDTVPQNTHFFLFTGRAKRSPLPPDPALMPPKGRKKKAEPGDAPPRRGRPPASFVIRGKAAVKKALDTLLPPKKKPDPGAPGSESTTAGGVLLSGDEARQAQLAHEEYGVQSEREDGDERPVWLQKIDWEMKGWVLKDTINTEDLPKWFEDQKNDYQRRGKHTESRSVYLQWFGHPGDSPHNIRARKFVVRWQKEVTPESELRTRAVSQKQPVWRWLYVCTGVHDRPPLNEKGEMLEQDDVLELLSEDGEGEDGASEGGSNAPASEQSGPPEQETRGRWKKCGDEVVLQFEVTADDLALVKIWQRGDHAEALDSQLLYLMFSRFLRLQILDRFRRWGAKVSTVQRDLVGRYVRLHSSDGVPDPLPKHRMPNATQISGMLTAGRQRERLDRNPFRATWLMVKRNPKDMYNYTAHDFTKPDSQSKFTIAITDDFSLDSTILNTAGPNGTLFMDSTHRLHNENRAATTVLCTANSGLHMMPGAYLISANIQGETIREFLVRTVHKIMERVEEAAKDPSTIHHRDPAERERIYRRCLSILQNGFDFTNINIDKSRSELNGILEALKDLGMHDVYIRLCQFHVIQAILRFDADSGGQGLGFAIPYSIKFEIIVLFRSLQRCRSWDGWDEAKQVFHEGLEELLSEETPETLAKEAAEEQESPVGIKRRTGVPKAKSKRAKAEGKSCLEVVKEYFNKNWFIMPWIPMFTDIGMPPGQSRDGTWNTNNWAETAFKQFNVIFLDNKHNKRIDRLASIILNDHLPFFRYFPTVHRPLRKEIVALHQEANRLWERDLVHATPSVPDRFTVNRITDQKPVMHTVVLSPLACTCYEYQQTGKDCVDILASRLLRSNGPIGNWHTTEYSTEADLGPKGERKKKKKKITNAEVERRKKLPNDSTLEAELNHTLDKLAALAETERDHEPEPFFGEFEFQVKNSGGRPPNAKPLHPWRHRRKPSGPLYATAGTYGHSPRFVKKRGPPRRTRLHWMSLFPAFRRVNNARRVAYFARMAEARRQAMMGVFSVGGNLQFGAADEDDGHSEAGFDPHVTFANHRPIPNDNDNFLNTEDLSLHTMDPSRWVPEGYEMRQDEMGVFIPIFNNSSAAIDQGIICLYGAPHLPFAEKIRALDPSRQLSDQELREAGLEQLADLIATRRNQQVNHILFFELRNRHWTTFHHNLTVIPVRITHFNSLPAPAELMPAVDHSDQLLLQQYLLRQKGIALPGIYFFATAFLGLQGDISTCGFWAVYVAFAILLQFDPENPAARSLTPTDIKELIGAIYLSFIGNEVGLPASLVNELFRKFAPRIQLDHLPVDSIFSPRPADMARANVDIQGGANQPQPDSVVKTDSHPSNFEGKNALDEPLPLTPASLDEGFSELLPREGGIGDDHQWIVIPRGPTVLAERLRKFTTRDLTSDGVIDGYFSLFCNDVASKRRCAVRDLPFVITDSIFANFLNRAKRDDAGMKPIPRSNERKFGKRKNWFEEFNIFEKDYLIVPMLSSKHWFLGAVFFRAMQIRVYDSIKHGGERRQAALYGRLFEMLQWEHKFHYTSALPSTWRPWSKTPEAIAETVPKVPQQDNAVDCGLFAMANGECVANGGDPSTLSYTGESATRDRVRIANCLHRGIRDCVENRAALGIGLTNQSAPEVSSPPVDYLSTGPKAPPGANLPEKLRTRHIPLDTVGHIAFFPAPRSPGLFLPARAVEKTQAGGFLVEWYCSPLFMDDSERPTGKFNCTDTEWRSAAGQICAVKELVPVMWPAARALVYRKFATTVFPADEALQDELRSKTTNIIRYLLGQDPASALFSELKTQYTNLQQASESLVGGVAVEISLFPQFQWLHIASHEAMVTDFSYEIERAIHASPLLHSTDPSREEVLRLADAIGGAFLWVTYIAFVANVEVGVAYEAMRAGRIVWPRSEADDMWDAYVQVCRTGPTSRMSEVLQVIVPDIEALPPVITP